jgi:hypothetical protein
VYTPKPNQTSGLEGGPITSYQELEIEIRVKVEEGALSGDNEARVFGSGVASRSARQRLNVGSAPTTFGVESYALSAENEGGGQDLQAGSHPFQVTSTFGLNTVDALHGEELFAATPEMAKDLTFNLPPGFIGNPTAFPRCTDQEFTTKPPGTNTNSCPADAAVGVAVPSAIEPSFLGLVPFKFVVPVFNLVPAVGEPARFGFTDVGVPVVLDTAVRTGNDYAVAVSAHNIDETAAFLGGQVTFWGVPGDPRHDNARGWKCLGLNGPEQSCAPAGQTAPPPLLTLPTSCNGPLHTSVEGVSWRKPTSVVSRDYTFQDSSGHPIGLNGCNRLSFDPRIEVSPDSQDASTPTGLTVGVHVPQDASLLAGGLAESSVKDTTVVLPEGVSLNPSAADGLLSCPLEAIALDSASLPSCPAASKVATVEIKSPLLPDPLIGAAYLAAQTANPFGSLIALYVVAEDKTAGVLVKLAGEVKPDVTTGQLVSTFKDTPQLPFEDLTVHFFGGGRAPLTTPALCGSYTTRATFTPWSGNAPSEPTSSFDILSGRNGTVCPSSLPFTPLLTAGSENIQAGGYTVMTTTLSREDGEQDLRGIELHMPPGLLGTLASVHLCGEADANAGSCGPDSLIGETTVSVGVGGSPFSVKGGQVYITGPYKRAPFGLSIVTPAKAGPFDLGTVVVRATIQVDPVTSALTVATDDTGPYQIPRILDGIPLEIKHVNVAITRPRFTFNPTSCRRMAITALMMSAQSMAQTRSVPFQVTNCRSLGFKPRFKVSTSARTSRVKGASLTVNLSYPKAAWGSQANIRSVKVELPKRLPSRLTTLQKACPDTVFEINPASCPVGSKVGSAIAITPIIPVALQGPAYFVSHGGARFPELIIVLQGYGVTVYLHGETFISGKGITSSTFRAVPDVPIGSFGLKLPQGSGSALAANGDLCKGKLTMPTAFVAQNGAVIHQNTPITVTGCVRHKTSRRIGGRGAASYGYGKR